MNSTRPEAAWRATIIFYLVLLLVITFLDRANGILTLRHWAIQVGLITLGITILALIGRKYPNLTAQRGVLLAFSIGVLTIIPAVLMVFNPPGEFWGQYFTIGMSMGSGSFLGFLFIELMDKRSSKQNKE